MDGGRGMRVLVADDDPVTRRLAALLLGRLGCDVDTAADGAEAVAAVGRIAYQAVLMDCEMPGLDGYGAAAEIRRQERARGRRRTPIVAVTASSFPADVDRAGAAGMDAHVVKPLRRDELEQVLDRILAATADHPPADPRPADPRAARPAPPARRPVGGDSPIELDEAPVLDPALAAALAGPVPDRGLHELVGLFLQEAPVRLRRLLDAAAAHDVGAVAEAAHHLTGSAAAFGAVRAARRSRRVEVAAREGSLPEPDVLAAVESALTDATTALARAVTATATVAPPRPG